jgi:hypothetical protein
MKRREFIERVAAGSANGALPVVGTLAAARSAGAAPEDDEHGEHGEVKASQSSATVSFGQWNTPIDRFPNNSPRALNNHQLIGERALRREVAAHPVHANSRRRRGRADIQATRQRSPGP